VDREEMRYKDIER